LKVRLSFFRRFFACHRSSQFRSVTVIDHTLSTGLYAPTPQKFHHEVLTKKRRPFQERRWDCLQPGAGSSHLNHGRMDVELGRILQVLLDRALIRGADHGLLVLLRKVRWHLDV